MSSLETYKISRNEKGGSACARAHKEPKTAGTRGQARVYREISGDKTGTLRGQLEGDRGQIERLKVECGSLRANGESRIEGVYFWNNARIEYWRDESWEETEGFPNRVRYIYCAGGKQF